MPSVLFVYRRLLMYYIMHYSPRSLDDIENSVVDGEPSITLMKSVLREHKHISEPLPEDLSQQIQEEFDEKWGLSLEHAYEAFVSCGKRGLREIAKLYCESIERPRKPPIEEPLKFIDKQPLLMSAQAADSQLNNTINRIRETLKYF